MMELGWTPELVPVEVVMIGSRKEAEYLGCYDLSETVKFEKSRLDLKAPDADAAQEEGSGNITGAYLISIYNMLQDEGEPLSNIFETDTVNGMFGFMFREPKFESEDLTEAQRAQREYLQMYIRDLEALIMTDDYIDEERHQQIADKMDLTSTADYWWVQMFSRNTDAYFTSSNYLYKPANDKLYWGPLWDFDLAWAFNTGGEELNPKRAEGYPATEFSWLDHLRDSDPYFVRLLKDRWRELEPKLGAFTADNGIIDRFKTELAAAQADDYRKWGMAPEDEYDYDGVSDYDAAVERFKQLIDARVVWFNENLETVGSFLTVSLDAAGGTGLMADINTVKKDGPFELPSCEFAPAAGSEFVGWKIGDELYREGDTVTLSKDTIVMAVWKVKAPEEDPSGDPAEMVLPVLPGPDKPVPVGFVVYRKRPGGKMADDASGSRYGSGSGRTGGENATDASIADQTGKYRSPDSGDGSEPLLWLMIIAVMGAAICGGVRWGKGVI